ncbi:carbohydrate-binding protein [Paraburkholderia terrae]|uniref:Carbohydrate-binding protein n=2 Tax=Paraburkholderia terrae TaxID=311230 RepID=A0A2I8EWT0_9BURK|nr:carbohydrate-binding protein [Paraburkholderia terrae]
MLPVIDFARDYPRGTLAQHQGGIWRAHANTHGAHGWSCVVDGIASTRVTMDSERSFTVHIERSGGAHETATFALPVLIYRGVYQADETYRAGDVVTWAGSLWHCNATTDTRPDAGGDAWTLAAKRGRDGKDARMRVVGEAA